MTIGSQSNHHALDHFCCAAVSSNLIYLGIIAVYCFVVSTMFVVWSNALVITNFHGEVNCYAVESIPPNGLN